MAKLYYGDAFKRLQNCETNPFDLTAFGKAKPIGIVCDFGTVEADGVGYYDEDAVNALCVKGIARAFDDFADALDNATKRA